MNEHLPLNEKFIINDLDDNHLFINENYLESVQTSLWKLLDDVTFKSQND